MIQINCNASGDAAGDTPRVLTDGNVTYPGEFESPARCLFRMPDGTSGGAYLRWAEKSVRFLLPALPGAYEGASLGLPGLDYAPAAQISTCLRVVGDAFADANGRWVWKGVTDFRLGERLACGQDIRPILAQRVDLGFNLVRVLAMKTNNTGWAFNPRGDGYWSAVEQLFALTAEVGLRVEWTVFADTAAVMPQEGEQQQFWAQTIALATRYPTVLLELLNEYGHGTQACNPLRFLEPSGIGVLASHGSGLTDAHPVEPFWDFSGYHARRDADACGFTNYDCYEFERDFPKRCPMIPDEGIQPPSYGYNPDYARRLGQHAACGAGGTLHWGAGVNSDLMDGATAACAAAFTAALR